MNKDDFIVPVYVNTNSKYSAKYFTKKSKWYISYFIIYDNDVINVANNLLQDIMIYVKMMALFHKYTTY